MIKKLKRINKKIKKLEKKKERIKEQIEKLNIKKYAIKCIIDIEELKRKLEALEK